MTTRKLLCALAAALAVVAVTLVGMSGPPAAADSSSVVRVDSGLVRGQVGDDHLTFSGIPYAAPPVGDRRWRPPATPARWSGVRDATDPSTPCPQAGYDDKGQPTVVGSEDCLTVDVGRPRSDRPGRPLPVIVWLHGGELTKGAASEYDGARLAVDGEAVVVTVNYRLGALGFLSSPALDAEGTVSGNYGLLDQAAALRWVRHNIAGFGGDPHKVTLAGQSSGARSVCTHLVSPGSRGLFHRAITQSGACATEVKTKANADANGAQATEELGCADAGTHGEISTCLRTAPVGALLGEELGNPGHQLGDRRDAAWGPVAGTPYLPWQPATAVRRGLTAEVPLLLGSNRHEARAFVLGKLADLTVEGYASMLDTLLGADVDAVLAEYPAADFDSPALALSAVLTDRSYACPTLDTARAARRHNPVYAYEFREEASLIGGRPFGAFHGWEVQFLFDTSIANSQYPPLTEPQQRLSETMIGYWSAFAHDGAPGGPGRPAWPAFGPRGPVIGISADGIRTTTYGAEHRCGFWAAR